MLSFCVRSLYSKPRKLSAFLLLSTEKLSMSKLTTIIALLCTTAFLGECTLEKPEFSRHITVTMPKSTTLTMGGQLYTVSLNKVNIHVNSSDADHKPCDMTIDPAKDSIQGEMRVDVSDDMIYIMGEHSVERVDEKDRTKYTLLMINPQDCTVKSADFRDVNVGIKPSLPRLLIHKTGVDVYFPSLKGCAPCRFNNQGSIMSAKNIQITRTDAQSDGWIYSFDIRKAGGQSYFFTQNMEGKKAMIKILDNSNKVTKEKEIDYPVDAMANTKEGFAGICSKTHDRMMMDIVAYKQIICEKINSELDSNSKIQIPIEPSRPISRVTYDIDGKGGKIFIAFAESKDLRVYVYDTAGKLLKSYDLGKIDERFEKYQHRRMFYMPYTHWNLRGFIMGKEYCLVTEQVSDTDKHEVDLHDVRCINV